MLGSRNIFDYPFDFCIFAVVSQKTKIIKRVLLKQKFEIHTSKKMITLFEKPIWAHKIGKEVNSAKNKNGEKQAIVEKLKPAVEKN